MTHDACNTHDVHDVLDVHESYLDNAATSRPLPEVVQAVCAAMEDGFGNASAEHDRGLRARDLLEESRAVIAEALDVDPDEIFFTSGGTESNNLAIVGAARAAFARTGVRGRIVASSLEHPSVTKSVRGLKREGWPVYYVPVQKGVLKMDALREKLDEQTTLVTCMSVQNELGYRFPVRDVVRLRDGSAPKALVHTDGVQAFGKIEFRPRDLGVDLASVSAHKIGGPQGIGALYVREGTDMFTTAFGGGQERGLRSGTEALPLIAGFATAVRIVFGWRKGALQNAADLNRMLLEGVREICPNVIVNSNDDGSPYIVNFSIPGLDNSAVLDFLSERGVYVSKASACQTLHPEVPDEDWKTKHPTVLQMAGIPKDLIHSTLRISFSPQSTADDVQAFIEGIRAFYADHT